MNNTSGLKKRVNHDETRRHSREMRKLEHQLAKQAAEREMFAEFNDEVLLQHVEIQQKREARKRALGLGAFIFAFCAFFSEMICYIGTALTGAELHVWNCGLMLLTIVLGYSFAFGLAGFLLMYNALMHEHEFETPAWCEYNRRQIECEQ